MLEQSLPIAEIFESVQGEGQNCGVAMTFIRLAGCNVGKPFLVPMEAPYQEMCTSWDGSHFACDTNYRMGAGRIYPTTLSVDPRVLRNRWVSVTGGEPLMHPTIVDLLTLLVQAGKHVHLETSGTIPMRDWMRTRHLTLLREHLHVVCSPKFEYFPAYLQEADEIRVLVGRNFDETNFLREFSVYLHKVWLSPVDNLMTLDIDNVNTCVALQQRHRELRLTTQMHKVWGVR